MASRDAMILAAQSLREQGIQASNEDVTALADSIQEAVDKQVEALKAPKEEEKPS